MANLSADVVKKFCDFCVWTHRAWKTRRIVFDDNPRVAEFSNSRFAYYLDTLSTITHEYSLQRARHLHHYHRIALRYAQEHFGPRQLDWIQQLIYKHANIRQALEYGLSEPGQVRTAMQTAAALWDFWFAGGFLREGYQWLRRALELDREPTCVRAEALAACAFLGTQLGEAETSTSMLAEARALTERNITAFAVVPQFFYLIHERVMQEIGKRGKITQRVFRAMLVFNRVLRKLGMNAGPVLFRKVHETLGPDW